ncbi:unnamed protein product [Acanthoscelides obtectus]|uniref:Uncharacterized protein n=1 Tax=Acanthoscelides obtectus TaxID=200917 RepID=A0A9P0KIH7_ACAOB|nr:unnamed protein product [Acanthoscelides obtectus]CAK1644817.1 Ankyrin-2 [Acanthoscelides obtectus]
MIAIIRHIPLSLSLQIAKDCENKAQPIDPELTAKLLGHGVAVSPVVTVEPRRRKFHKAITLSMPAPRAHSQGMINQYSGSAPTLRLLCSITGKDSLDLYFNKKNSRSYCDEIL